MKGDSIDTLSLIARIAGKAIQREREQRRETGVTSDGVRSVLLLQLTIIKRLARAALPEEERAALLPEENPSWLGGSHKRSERRRMNLSVSGRLFTSSPYEARAIQRRDHC